MWIGGFDPSARAPGEGIFAPVARVGVQCHQVRDDEGILGDVDVATVGLEHLRLIARVLGYSGQGVVQAKGLQLFQCLVSKSGTRYEKKNSMMGMIKGLTRTARVLFNLGKTSSYFQDWRSSDRR